MNERYDSSSEGQTKKNRLVRLAQAAFSPHERAAKQSGSDPTALRMLISKGGLKLYYEHIPATKGKTLRVELADDSLESD